jgi:hypothetical protein
MRIVFFVLRNLHLPHLMPVYRWLKALGNDDLELSFSGAQYIPSTAGQPGYGLEPEITKTLINSGIKWIDSGRLIAHKPDIVVMADADFRNGINQIGAKIVNINHGLISKGCFYSDSPLTLRENDADLICVPGSFHHDALKRTVMKPVVVTGLVKFDRIFSGELTREKALKFYGINPDKQVILFAPTYNRELSAVPMVTDKLRNWINDDQHLIIKLHGMSPPEWVELYRLIAEQDSRISLITDLDLTPCLAAADVMVSDVSSAFMEFISLDKPVVLVNNPLRTSFIGFDPRDIEYVWRDVGIEVDKAEDIPEAIRMSLANPLANSKKRCEYAARLIGTKDGLASQRVGQAIIELSENRHSNQYLNPAMQMTSNVYA